MYLVIVESPKKAVTIGRMLGSDYHVIATAGHVRDLRDDTAGVASSGEHWVDRVAGVDLDGSFQPHYAVLSDKKSIVDELRVAAADAQAIWFATDPDREGEAIAWHVASLLDVELSDTKRLSFTSITREAIEVAFASARPISIGRVNAQQARRVLDRIVGFQLSELLRRKLTRGLTAGRVQSVALRFLAEREAAIERHEPKTWWSIGATLTTRIDAVEPLQAAWTTISEQPANGELTHRGRGAWLSRHDAVFAQLVEFDGHRVERLDEDQALEAAQVLGFRLGSRSVTSQTRHGRAAERIQLIGKTDPSVSFVVESVDTTSKINSPDPPFTTTTLQRAAASRLGFGLRRTMQAAQRLYEGVSLDDSGERCGLVTYIRTDATQLAPEAIESVRDWIVVHWGEHYLPDVPIVYQNQNDSAQEAHEAIRPTDVSMTPERIVAALGDTDDTRLYALIWRRFVACQMVGARLDRTVLRFSLQPPARPSRSAVLETRGQVLVFDGHYRALQPEREVDPLLPSFERLQFLAAVAIEPRQHVDPPPARYTEASLQKTLEKYGIGRPATYADTIEKLRDRGYAASPRTNTRSLKITKIGRIVAELLQASFPDVLSADFTGRLEQDLDRIENDGDWCQTLERYHTPFRQALEVAVDTLPGGRQQSWPSRHPCPDCGSDAEYRIGRHGVYLACRRNERWPLSVEIAQHAAPEGGWWLHKPRRRNRPTVWSEDKSSQLSWSRLDTTEKERLKALVRTPPGCTFACTVDHDGEPLEKAAVDIRSPIDGRPMLRIRKPDGEAFLGSAGYPNQDFTLALDRQDGHVVLPRVEPCDTSLPCPACRRGMLQIREGRHGVSLRCAIPNCRRSLSLTTLDDTRRTELESTWRDWTRRHPTPTIVTVSGRVLTGEDRYVPAELTHHATATG